MIDLSQNHFFIKEVLQNETLAWGLLACVFAQFSKLIIEIIFFKRWRPQVLIETGGMPSSHSAFVTGTTSCIGWTMGFDHPVFALSATISFIVMYDSSGIRRAAGLAAERVNSLSEDLWQKPYDKPLKESLGHTRIQVLVGSIIGPAVALPGLIFFGSPWHIASLIITRIS